jgi:hypothetical protein
MRTERKRMFGDKTDKIINLGGMKSQQQTVMSVAVNK